MIKSNILTLIVSIIITLTAFLTINYSINKDTDTSLSYINIMNTNYKNSRDYALDEYYIYDYKDKVNKLKEVFKSSPITARLKYRASLISYIGEEEIVINGIDIKNDNEVFDILKNETAENFDSNNSIIISKSIASVLDVNTNDTVILKLITKTGHYNAEEYTVIEISEKLDYDYALIDIDNLNNFIGMENTATEVYVKKNISDLSNYDNDIKTIFGDDFYIYSKSDILGENYNINEDNKIINIYILLVYLFVLFSVFLFINSYTVRTYKILLKSKVLFSFIGFIISFIIYFIIVKLYYKTDFIFNYIYACMLAVNILSVLSANLKYSILENLFIIKEENYNKNKNLLIVIGLSFTYALAFILLYLSFLSFTNDISNNKKLESIVRIVKDNTSENTFLFKGSVDDNIYNMLYREIESYDRYAEIERAINFPVGVVIRTGSIASRVYTYEKNILESGLSISNIIIEGEVFESPKREIIIGKDLAKYLNLKIGDALSLIAKASRGWLETGYFYVSGIYDLKDRNYDIIGDITAMNSFIYLKEGDKSPYNESIIVFSDNENIYYLLAKSDFVNSNNLRAVSANEEYYTEHSILDKNVIILFIISLAFTLSLLSSSILSIFNRRLSKFIMGWYKKVLLNILYLVSLLSSIIVSVLIIFILIPFSFKFLLFSISIVVLSFLLSILVSNYNNI
ncbi:hypothetical protein [Brachyspira innocens]|uniref:hypothetical protein n=1 Tax=Brachyspira innocens TaxID=13264 RepID=UPI0026E9C697|nr:hypothetical protein [Brachyspira innocens]